VATYLLIADAPLERALPGIRTAGVELKTLPLTATPSEIADLAPVAAVDDPAVACEHRLEQPAELVVGRLLPVRAVNQGVELDERHAQPACELPSQRRLAVSARGGDHGHLPHGSTRVSSSSMPSEVTR